MDNQHPICDFDGTQGGGSSASKKQKALASGVKKNLCWVTTHDEYFIDVMVEQCNYGRRIAGGFTSEGWNEMAEIIQKKFGDNFTKDKLKNRFKTIKKQYSLMKTMLGLSGFIWDDILKIVTADKEVWTEYIKEHPEASVYQTRHPLDFNKMAIIFGDAIADGRDVLLSTAPSYPNTSLPNPICLDATQVSSTDDVVVEVASEPAHMEKRRSASSVSGMDNQPPKCDFDGTRGGGGSSTSKKRKALASGSKKNLCWVNTHDECFIDILVEQCNYGRRIVGGFTSEAWSEMAKIMKNKFGDNFTKDKLKNRLKTLKKKYSLMKTMLGMSGFSWDDIKKVVIADTVVWAEYIKEHPKAAVYQTRPPLDFNKMKIVFEDTIANERDVLLSTAPSYPNTPPPDPIGLDVAQVSSTDDEVPEVGSEPTHMEKRQSAGSVSGKTRRRRSNSEDALTLAARAFSAAISQIKDIIIANSSSKPKVCDYICYLDELGLSRDDRIKALRILRDDRVAEQFIGQRTVDERREFLLAELSDFKI